MAYHAEERYFYTLLLLHSFFFQDCIGCFLYGIIQIFMCSAADFLQISIIKNIGITFFRWLYSQISLSICKLNSNSLICFYRSISIISFSVYAESIAKLCNVSELERTYHIRHNDDRMLSSILKNPHS